jgi:hypothetical protein
MKLDAEWTDDCQGKKDYDAEILGISTRYWPRGGGFSIFDRDKPEAGLQDNETRPGIKPSAKSELVIRHAGEGLETWTVLAAAEFEAETEDEVKAAVEEWAQAQMDKAVAALMVAFAAASTQEETR